MSITNSTQNTQLNMLKISLCAAGLCPQPDHHHPLDEAQTRREISRIVAELPAPALLALFWVAALLAGDSRG